MVIYDTLYKFFKEKKNMVPPYYNGVYIYSFPDVLGSFFPCQIMKLVDFYINNRKPLSFHDFTECYYWDFSFEYLNTDTPTVEMATDILTFTSIYITEANIDFSDISISPTYLIALSNIYFIFSQNLGKFLMDVRNNIKNLIKDYTQVDKDTVINIINNAVSSAGGSIVGSIPNINNIVSLLNIVLSFRQVDVSPTKLPLIKSIVPLIYSQQPNTIKKECIYKYPPPFFLTFFSPVGRAQVLK